MSVGRVAVLVAALSASSCGARLIKLPTQLGMPAADADAALAAATAACSRVSTMSAEVAVRGSVGGQRFRGRLLVGLVAPDSMFIEAPAPFGAPLFILGVVAGDATLLLPRERRVLEHASASAIMEALAGVPLDAAGLRATLTGCVAVDGRGATEARQSGDGWRVFSGDPVVYLHRERVGEPWRLVSAQLPPPDGWRTDYAVFSSGPSSLPRSIRLVSNAPRRFDLRLELSQVDINTGLDPAMFLVEVPRGAQPISLDELRASGPLSR